MVIRQLRSRETIIPLLNGVPFKKFAAILRYHHDIDASNLYYFLVMMMFPNELSPFARRKQLQDS